MVRIDMQNSSILPRFPMDFMGWFMGRIIVIFWNIRGIWRGPYPQAKHRKSPHQYYPKRVSFWMLFDQIFPLQLQINWIFAHTSLRYFVTQMYESYWYLYITQLIFLAGCISGKDMLANWYFYVVCMYFEYRMYEGLYGYFRGGLAGYFDRKKRG